MSQRTTALVTGGAGLIGSHIVDQALAAGWDVRILDSLERQTHRSGKPPWIPQEADFLRGDVRRRRDWERALDGVDVVFHEAAYGGYMPEIAKFIHVNAYGTALLLETIRERKLPVRKVVLASSQAVYNEGAYRCPDHGHFFGVTRAVAQLARGDFEMRCPFCGAAATPAPTSEDAPMGGENVYAISKADQERLLISCGRATGIPVVALRYSCTYGPRQSLFNPYTGVIAIFCTRLLNDRPPIVYEDGHQSRDLIFVDDVARANMLVATDERANGRIFNVGTGQAVEIGELARILARRLDKEIEPLLPGEFRPGEMRALISDVSRIAELGFQPAIDLATGIDRYLDWISAQGPIKDYFAAAERILRRKQIVQRAIPAPTVRPTAAVVVPALNEEATVGDLIAEIAAVAVLPDLPVSISQIVLVDNGSTDATSARAVAAGATVVAEPLPGYGRACLCGVLATGDVDLIVLMDADRSDCPFELDRLIAPMLAGDVDLVIGSRVLGRAEPGSLLLPQRVGNQIAALLLRLLYGVRMTDIGPFRVIRKRDLLALGMSEMTYGWSVEMIVRAAQLGLRVAEVPVSYRKRAGGQSKVSGNLAASIRAGYRILSTIVRCRIGPRPAPQEGA
ncbi:MAG: NAD-dependent epimerase/dehydratase family protein [Thermomicrobiales bacterium]